MKSTWHLTTLFALFFVLSVAQPTFAQKAKKEDKPKSMQSSEAASLREVLSKHVGQTCNLGTIKKVTGEYVVIEHEGATMIHPLHAIHTIKMFKDEETGADMFEIRLIAAD